VGVYVLSPTGTRPLGAAPVPPTLLVDAGVSAEEECQGSDQEEEGDEDELHTSSIGTGLH
jgi:hypothetical protein